MRPALFFLMLALTAAAPARAQSFHCAPGDVEFATGKGSAVIEGQAFLKTKADVVKYGAGNQVELVPVCDGVTLWLAKQIKWQKDVPLDSTVARATRTTTADAEGRFRFVDVPPGDYYVVSSVWWHIPTKYAKVGGYVSERVHAADGQTASIVVTDKAAVN